MAIMWKYISGVSKVVHKKKNEKAPKAVRDTREDLNGWRGGLTFGLVKTCQGECILRVTCSNGGCSQN